MTAYLGDDHYRAVAAMSLDGVKHEDIARAYDVPLSTVVGWVRRARRKGMLPPTVRGRSATGWSRPGYAADVVCPTCGSSASRWRRDWRDDDTYVGRHAR